MLGGSDFLIAVCVLEKTLILLIKVGEFTIFFITVNLTGSVGDYAEIITNNLNDIPAYGYFTGEL